MNGRVFLLVASLAAAVLAGCTSPASDPPTVDNPGLVVVAATDLTVGGVYAFRHDGGELVFATKGNSSAEVVLFGGDDRRIGRIGVGDQDATGRFVLDEVAAGELVVEVRALDGDGGLDIRSGGDRVLLYDQLPVHVERHVLLQEPFGPLDLGLPGVPGTPAQANVDLQLRRAPTALRLLAHGTYQELAVVVTGDSGPVLQAEATGGAFFQQGFGPFGYDEVPSRSFTENVRSGHLSAQASAADFHGVLVLEAWSFSRARPVPSMAEPTSDVPRFTYGLLPDQPVSFDVREGTQWIYLLFEGDDSDVDGPSAQESCRGVVADSGGGDEAEQACDTAALVGLFGPDDRRVATVRVPFNETVAVPVHAAGEWVAALLFGAATLGADRAPADFELHPLEVRSAEVPSGPASGETGSYGQATADATGPGTVYRLRGVWRSPEVFQFPVGTSPACGPASLVAVQGGETIGAWGFDGAAPTPGSTGAAVAPHDSLAPDSLLDGRALSVVHDDFGPDCARIALVVDGFVR